MGILGMQVHSSREEKESERYLDIEGGTVFK